MNVRGAENRLKTWKSSKGKDIVTIAYMTTLPNVNIVGTAPIIQLKVKIMKTCVTIALLCACYAIHTT